MLSSYRGDDEIQMAYQWEWFPHRHRRWSHHFAWLRVFGIWLDADIGWSYMRTPARKMWREAIAQARHERERS